MVLDYCHFLFVSLACPTWKKCSGKSLFYPCGRKWTSVFIKLAEKLGVGLFERCKVSRLLMGLWIKSHVTLVFLQLCQQVTKTTKERQIYFNGIAISLDLISMGVNLDICLEEPEQSSNIGNWSILSEFLIWQS